MNRVLFIMLLQPKGKGLDAVKHLQNLKTPAGVTLKEVYFTFGRFDGVVIFEADNEVTAMSFAMQTGITTQYTVETLIAVPAKEIK